MSWQIVRHAFALVFNNLSHALKVSLGPFLIGLVLAVVLGFALNVPLMSLGAIDQNDPQAALRAFPLIVALLIIYLVIFAWVAVGWHRFVLLEEYPGILPAFGGRPIGAYAWRSVLLGLLLVLVAVPLLFVLGLVFTPFAGDGVRGLFVLGLIFGIVMGSLLAWFWFRIALVLPSLAVGQPLKIGESWAVTKPLSGTIFGVVVILTVLNIAATSLLGLIGAGLPLVAQVINLGVTWVFLMVGVSILTTLYGHLIEKRDLV